MNILMLYPRFLEPTFWNPHCAGRLVHHRSITMAPLGLLTIASYLPDDFNVRLVDRNVAPETAEDWAWADVVFLSAMAAQEADYSLCVATARAHGKRIAIGGPYTHNAPDRVAQDGDWVCFGEGEDIVEEFVADLQADVRPRQYQGGNKTNMERVRIPRFSLLPDINAYVTMPVQFSRGCPFKCEFCDIIEIYGRVPRTKPPEHLLAELSELKRLGFRGNVFVVDDNFIGNKVKARAMCERLVEWNRANGSPFSYCTEASLNLADEKPLLEVMSRAQFTYVFVGIETPDPKLLAITQKRQNLIGDPLEKLQQIRDYGIYVSAGFILGFDGEDRRVFETQGEFLEASGIAVAIISLLEAIPNTQLSRRLHEEGRLVPTRAHYRNTPISGINFIPKGVISKREYLAEYATFLRHVYQPARAFARSRRGLMAVRAPVRVRPFSFYRTYLPTFLRLLYHVGIKARGFRVAFWRTLFTVLVKNPGAIDGFYFDAVYLYHLHPFAEHVAREAMKYAAAPDEEGFLDEIIPPGPAPRRLQTVARAQVG
jgi:radical SAM superfamily enzyme YgiQ (UPF0313 family)